jgi:hypothetical protein
VDYVVGDPDKRAFDYVRMQLGQEHRRGPINVKLVRAFVPTDRSQHYHVVAPVVRHGQENALVLLAYHVKNGSSEADVDGIGTVDGSLLRQLVEISTHSIRTASKKIFLEGLQTRSWAAAASS